jgi:hypothetical protein
MLLSFGDVQFDIITPNIENVTQNLENIPNLDTIANLTPVIHFVLSPTFASMLDLGALEHDQVQHDDVYWVTPKMPELRDTCRDMAPINVVPTSDIERITFAHNALAHNKRRLYRMRILKELLEQTQELLRPLAPHRPETALGDSHGQNTLYAPEPTHHDTSDADTDAELTEMQAYVDDDPDEALLGFLVDDNPSSDQDILNTNAWRPATLEKARLKNGNPLDNEDETETTHVLMAAAPMPMKEKKGKKPKKVKASKKEKQLANVDDLGSVRDGADITNMSAPLRRQYSRGVQFNSI